MSIVKYFTHEGRKVFDVGQALIDGWGITLAKLPGIIGALLTDRQNPSHRATILSITHDRIFNMWFVHYAEGGSQCLDHSIEQFERI